MNMWLTHTPLMYYVQSFWRDEAFSVLAAQQPLSFIVSRLGFEPPVYYTLLHFWMRVFGEGEIAVRSLSVIAFLLTTVIVIEWAHDQYKKHWLSWYLPLFFFFNPMLLYYAFEVRTYAWYMLFATLTLYAYTKGKWVWFTVAATLGFYTHVYLLPFIGILGLHHVLTKRESFSSGTLTHRFRTFWKDSGVRSFMFVILLIVPWLTKIGFEAYRMRSSWYFPVNFQLVRSALGNMFLGYEGTPWYGWQYTSYLSLGIIGAAVLAYSDKKRRSFVSMLILFAMAPLGAIIGISFIKPLFVNRYLIPVTIAEVFIIVAAVAAIRNHIIQKTTAFCFLAAVLWFNWWYPPQHPKVPIRATFEQINMLVKDQDVILANDPLIYLETLYYAKDRSRVFLYNPQNGEFPWYIGDALFSPSRVQRDFPVYPQRAFLVRTDASFDVTYRMPL